MRGAVMELDGLSRLDLNCKSSSSSLSETTKIGRLDPPSQVGGIIVSALNKSTLQQTLCLPALMLLLLLLKSTSGLTCEEADVGLTSGLRSLTEPKDPEPDLASKAEDV